MNRRLIFLLAGMLISFSVIPATSSAQDKPAYVLYSGAGRKIKYSRMINRLQSKDIVLFGELHNNPIAHWLELTVTEDLFKRRKLILGAEMFERDNQLALNLYLQGKIKENGLDSMARLWGNFATDYKPLVDFARVHGIPFAATNIPRRYASLVAHRGLEALDSLPEHDKQWIAPLPIAYDGNLPGYKNMMGMLPGHGGLNLPKAQAIKDATMAYSILQYYQPGSLFIHFNGSYHTQNYEGILWYLRRQRPDLKYASITVVSQKNIRKLLPENLRKADFIICVDEEMTTTY